MIKNRFVQVLLILLVASLIFNGLLIKGYIDKRKYKIEIEKGILMNEFSERTKEWRNFNQFLQKLTEQESDRFPISEEESYVYWELAKPMESVVIKTSEYINEADYGSYNDYLRFIGEFDYEYEWIVDLFRKKLPIMNREQVIELSTRFDKTYKMYMGEGLVEWGIRTPKFYVNFEPDKEILDEVIKELDLIREYLEAIDESQLGYLFNNNHELKKELT